MEVMILFPSGGNRSMKDEFPELANVPEFENCSADEMRFVWYYSYFYKYMASESDRIRLSMEAAFLRGGRWNNMSMGANVREQYADGNFPEYIRVAMSKMGNYDPEARFVAKLLAESTLRTYNQMVADISLDIASKGEIDWDIRKKQVDTMATINKELPNIISQVETGYGVKKTVLGKGDYITGMVDKWHENNK